MSDDLRELHPGFVGEWKHLRRFCEVLNTPIHSDERGKALTEWSAYNTVDRDPPGAVDAKTGFVGKVAKWQDYRGFRGVDLRGASLSGIFCGTIDLGGALLDGVNLANARLKAANFRGASLQGVNLAGALLLDADFQDANIQGANLRDAQLEGADLRRVMADGGTSLVGADLSDANLSGAKLRDVDLTGACLRNATLVGANLEGSILDRCVVYGVSAWDLEGAPAKSNDLVITAHGTPITVDRLDVAQFVYLLVQNPKIRDVLDTVTQKVVLILGRFTDERKIALDAMRDALRDKGFVPVLFDFAVPKESDITDTVTMLARMARFIVADLTDPASIPQELTLIVPQVLVPVCPVILAGEKPWSMFADLRRRYHWLLEPFEYETLEQLIAAIDTTVVEATDKKRKELRTS